MKTITHNGVPCVEARVHRLPIEDTSRLELLNQEYFVCECIKPMSDVKIGELKYLHRMLTDLEYWRPQHLYILSDEEIKKGDWFVKPVYKGGIKIGYVILQADSSYFGGYGYDWEDCHKIIATTDTELHYNKVVEEDMHMYKESLPHIPQHIIEAYVKKPFDKVLVEYEEWTTMYRGMANYKLKLNQDETLAVSLVEEKMYSKEEKMYSKEELLGLTMGNSNIIDWINENL